MLCFAPQVAIPRPSPCFLDDCEPLGVRNKRKIWRDRACTRFYTWDELHGEIEVFNNRGRHLGVLDGVSGVLIKGAVKGRKIDV